jgi:predicted kinase
MIEQDGTDRAGTDGAGTDGTASDGDERASAAGDHGGFGTASEAESVSLVVVCGPPGVGKTTVASEAAEQVDGTVLRTDVVRKDLFPEPSYDEAETDAVYDELLARSRERLADGESVVLDGTFRTERQRERAATLATECGGAFELFRVACEESIVRRRIEDREDDASDADFDIHQMIREEFEPISRDHARIDNSGSCAETCASVAERL